MKEHYVDVSGGRLRTVSTGSGVPVLLWSGGPGCPDYLEPVASMLESGCHCIRFDPRACGRSLGGPGATAAPAAGSAAGRLTVAGAVEDAEAIREAYDIPSWTVLGHSFGADLALHYALRHPNRVRALICFAGGRVGEDREWYREYRRRRDRGDEHQPEFDFPPNLHAKAELTDAWREECRRPALLRELADLGTHATFIYPQEDIRPRWAVEQIAGLLPKGEFSTIPGCGHFAWLEDRQAVAEALEHALVRADTW